MFMVMEPETTISVAIELDAQIHDMIARLQQYEEDPEVKDAIEALTIAHERINGIISGYKPKD